LYYIVYKLLYYESALVLDKVWSFGGWTGRLFIIAREV